MAVYPLGIAGAAIVMQQPVLARVVPTAAGVVVLIAGALLSRPTLPALCHLFRRA